MDLRNVNDQTLKAVGADAAAAGVVWALLTVLLIYLGSTLLPPRLRLGQIWQNWQRKRMIWAAGVVLPAVGAVLTGEWIARAVGFRNLYWFVRGADIVVIGRMGGLSGYVLGVFLVVLWGLVTRNRRGGSPRAPNPNRAKSPRTPSGNDDSRKGRQA